MRLRVILSCMLAAMISLMLFACGGGETPSEDNSQSVSNEQTSGEAAPSSTDNSQMPATEGGLEPESAAGEEDILRGHTQEEYDRCLENAYAAVKTLVDAGLMEEGNYWDLEIFPEDYPDGYAFWYKDNRNGEDRRLSSDSYS